MNKELYITITGFKNYYGLNPFDIGRLILCKKEPDNPYDENAISCSLPYIGKVGYVANSNSTVAGGTLSADEIYDETDGIFFVRVMFTSFTKVICKVESITLNEFISEAISEAFIKEELLTPPMLEE